MHATTTNVLALVGSLRADSLNRRIAEALREHPPVGVTVQIADGLHELPFYNEDLDRDTAPAPATALRQAVADADALLAITPEYNGTMPALVKNAIDWLSRPYGTGAIKGKSFGVIGATPTEYGGRWAHEDIRRSAAVAGARVIDGALVSQSALDIDVVNDPDVADRFHQVLRLLRHTRLGAA